MAESEVREPAVASMEGGVRSYALLRAYSDVVNKILSGNVETRRRLREAAPELFDGASLNFKRGKTPQDLINAIYKNRENFGLGAITRKSEFLRISNYARDVAGGALAPSVERVDELRNNYLEENRRRFNVDRDNYNDSRTKYKAAKKDKRRSGRKVFGTLVLGTLGTLLTLGLVGAVGASIWVSVTSALSATFGIATGLGLGGLALGLIFGRLAFKGIAKMFSKIREKFKNARAERKANKQKCKDLKREMKNYRTSMRAAELANIADRTYERSNPYPGAELSSGLESEIVSGRVRSEDLSAMAARVATAAERVAPARAAEAAAPAPAPEVAEEHEVPAPAPTPAPEVAEEREVPAPAPEAPAPETPAPEVAEEREVPAPAPAPAPEAAEEHEVPAPAPAPRDRRRASEAPVSEERVEGTYSPDGHTYYMPRPEPLADEREHAEDTHAEGAPVGISAEVHHAKVRPEAEEVHVEGAPVGETSDERERAKEESEETTAEGFGVDYDTAGVSFVDVTPAKKKRTAKKATEETAKKKPSASKGYRSLNRENLWNKIVAEHGGTLTDENFGIVQFDFGQALESEYGKIEEKAGVQEKNRVQNNDAAFVKEKHDNIGKEVVAENKAEPNPEKKAPAKRTRKTVKEEQAEATGDGFVYNTERPVDYFVTAEEPANKPEEKKPEEEKPEPKAPVAEEKKPEPKTPETEVVSNNERLYFEAAMELLKKDPKTTDKDIEKRFKEKAAEFYKSSVKDIKALDKASLERVNARIKEAISSKALEPGSEE